MKFFKSILIIIVIFSGNYAYSSDEVKDESNWRIGPQIGFSQFTGIIGAEFQKNNYALTLGLPTCIGIKYYTNSEGRQWYFGVNAMQFEYEDDIDKDGVRYDEEKLTQAAVSLGYKWRFKQFWEFTLGASLAYYEKEYSNTMMSRKDEYIGILPDISIGCTF